MAELVERVGLIVLQRDRVIPEMWTLTVTSRPGVDVSRTYQNLGKALNAIASEMYLEVEPGVNWLKRSA